MILLSTSSLSWYSIHRILGFAKKSWYEWLDLSLTKLEYDLWDENYIKWLSDAFNIPIHSITAPMKWMNEELVKKIVKIWKRLNTSVITFSPPHLMDWSTKRFFEYLPKLKKESWISICIQNVELKFLFFIIPEYRNSTLSQLKKITGDTALDLSAIDSSSWTDILKASWELWLSIKNIFVSDRDWPNFWLVPWSIAWWLSHLPLESFFIKLKNEWYPWFFTLKVKPTEIWVGNEEKVLQNLEYVKKYYEKYFINFK